MSNISSALTDLLLATSNSWTATQKFNDDVLVVRGSDSDVVEKMTSAVVAADAEPDSNVYKGTSVHQATALNSLVRSNTTANGDVQELVNNGGNSLEWLLVDTSAKAIYFGHGFDNKLILGDPLDGNIVNAATFYGGAGAVNTAVLAIRYQDIAGAGSASWVGAAKASGTQASPAATVTLARVAEFTGLGWDGTNWRGLGQYGVEAVGATSATNRGGKLYFETRYQNDPTDVTAWYKWMTLGDNGVLLLDQTVKPAAATAQSIPFLIQSPTQVGIRVVNADGTAGNTSFLSLVHHAGTIASPAATATGSKLGQLSFGGYTNAITGSALVEGWATELWTATAKGSKLVFSTVDNTTLVQDQRLILDQDGQAILGLGEAGTTLATGNTFRAPDITTGGAGNIAGADLIIAAGLGTGIGDVGTVIFSLPVVAATGDNIQTRAARLTLDMAGGANLYVQSEGTGASGMILKNLKNAAASALSGTQLDVEIDIGGTPYYFTVYPTKA